MQLISKGLGLKILKRIRQESAVQDLELIEVRTLGISGVGANFFIHISLIKPDGICYRTLVFILTEVGPCRVDRRNRSLVNRFRVRAAQLEEH